MLIDRLSLIVLLACWSTMLGQGLLAAGPSSESLSTDLSAAARGPDATGSGALGCSAPAPAPSSSTPPPDSCRFCP